MNIFIFTIFILLLITVIPIPFKLKVIVTKDKKSVKLYKKELLTNKKIKKPKKRNKETRTIKESILDTVKTKFFISTFIQTLNTRKHKPIIHINGFINYSLGDPSKTAISYGLVSTLASFLYKILKVAFKFKKSKLLINPLLEKKADYAVKFDCIIYISLGQLIHILIIFVSCILKSKEVSLFGENYE